MQYRIMKNADKYFSLYIRLRDSDENGNAKCCTCGKIQYFREMDCGHFVNRKHMSLRYSEVNCHTQCRSCNRFDEGNLPSYSLFMQKTYGNEIIEKLLIAKGKTNKLGHFELQGIAVFYKAKANELAKLKGIKTPLN